MSNFFISVTNTKPFSENIYSLQILLTKRAENNTGIINVIFCLTKKKIFVLIAFSMQTLNPNQKGIKICLKKKIPPPNKH